MCETSKIAFVAICVRSSYKMPGLYLLAHVNRQIHNILAPANKC